MMTIDDTWDRFLQKYGDPFTSNCWENSKHERVCNDDNTCKFGRNFCISRSFQMESRMTNDELVLTINILQKEIEVQNLDINPHDTGHIRTAVGVMEDRVEELMKGIKSGEMISFPGLTNEVTGK